MESGTIRFGRGCSIKNRISLTVPCKIEGIKEIIWVLCVRLKPANMIRDTLRGGNGDESKELNNHPTKVS
jgi:hypothetical protein